MLNNENRYLYIGKRIREAREALGISQRELALELGYESSTAISYIESGDRKISVVDLEKVAKHLGRDIRFFIGQDIQKSDVRVALRAEGISDKDHSTIMHIIEMAKKRNQNGE